MEPLCPAHAIGALRGDDFEDTANKVGKVPNCKKGDTRILPSTKQYAGQSFAVLERPLVCVECGALSDERAEGWRAVLAGGLVDGVDRGELEVGVYCPECAEREFSERRGFCDSALEVVAADQRAAAPSYAAWCGGVRLRVRKKPRLR